MNARRNNLGWHAAALLALLLLSFANVQSVVMQAAMALSGDMMPACGSDPVGGVPVSSMAGMDMGAAATASSAHRDHRPDAAYGHHAACPYCAAAAHSPLPGHAVALRHAADFVFATFQVVASKGPRGPPADSLTA